jgi:hypothetical protein
MGRIDSYATKGKIIDGDKWIGTDSSGQATKNFGPEGIAEYLNEANVLASSGSVTFLFQSDSTGGRKSGSISFNSFGGNNTSLDSISQFKLSKNANGDVLVIDYVLTMIGKRILLSEVGAPNIFGIYDVINIAPSIYTDFYDVDLSIVSSNGVLTGEKFYSIGIYPDATGVSPGTGDLTHTHTQNVAASVWLVTHNLNKFPSPVIELSTGQVGYGDIMFINADSYTITFAGDNTGRAHSN